MENKIRIIVERYEKFIEGHDEDWIYDSSYEFFNDLSRGEIQELMDYLVKLKQSNSVPRVGSGATKGAYKQSLRTQPTLIAYDANLPDVILCDIDGTLALFGDKNPYERDVLKDEVNGATEYVLNKFENDVKIILVSGRKNKYLKDTMRWLAQEQVPFDEILMPRGDKDFRKDVIIKQEVYDQHIKGKYNVLFVLDDRNQVVDFWRSIGLTCFQVAAGAF